MMVLIGGGLVSFWGPAIGALFFILARDVLGAATETWLFWYGLLFIAMVLLQPEGIAGMWQAFAPPARRAPARTRGTQPRRPRQVDARPGVPARGKGALHGPL